MGWLVHTQFIDAIDKNDALRKGLEIANELAYYEGDRYEGSDEYHGNFKFFDKRFEHEDEAIEFFNSLRKGEDGIVIAKQASKSSENNYNKRMNSLVDRRKKLLEEVLEAFKQRKSATIGCKNCGNRMDKNTAVKYSLKCSKCWTPLYSEGVAKRFRKIDDAIENLENIFKQNISDKGKYKYFIKVSIHV